MIKRPTSVTVVAWLLIVISSISFVSLTVMINDSLANEIMSKTPIPLYIQYALAYAGLVVMIVSGVAMIKGCNWARYLYTIWVGAALSIGLAVSPMKTILIPQIVVFAIVVLLLFRPTATAYFVQKGVSNDAQGV